MTIFCLLLLACCGSAMGQVTPIVTSCDGLVDIVFILDSSSSMHQMGPQTVRNFTADVSTHFTIGPDNVRVGLATHSDTISPVFNLSTYSDNTNLAAALRTDQSSTSSTGTSISLNEVTKMFSPEAGGRANARKVIIILSDIDRVYMDARHNKELGYRIITVPISEFDLPNLVRLTSGPNDVLSVNDVESLPNVQENLIRLLCPPSETPEKLSLAADIIFVLDSSQDSCENSLSTLSYDHVRNFAVAITERFSLGEAAARFGAVVFSTTPSKVFDLKDHSNHTTLAAALRAAPYLDGISNISKALSFITEEEMFDSAKGGRENASQVVVFVTHSSIITEQDEESITSLKRQGVHVELIVVGYAAGRAIKCTDSLDDEDAFYGGGFYALEYLQAPLLNEMVKEITNDAKCDVKAKIFFVIESSDRITPTEFAAALAFAAELAAQFKLGPENATIFAMTFGGDTIRYLLNSKNVIDEATLTRAFTSASYINGSANWGKALDSFSLGTHQESAVPNLRYVILMSNGRPVFRGERDRTFFEFDLSNLDSWLPTKIVVAIGQDPNVETLTSWASEGHYYANPNSEAIDNILGIFPGCMRTPFP